MTVLSQVCYRRARFRYLTHHHLGITLTNMSAEPFPNTLVEVITYFRDEAVCREFLAGLRWPNGVACPFCQCDKVGHVTTRALWRCKTCRRQFSVK